MVGVVCFCLFLSFWARGKTQREEQQRDMMGRESVLCLSSAGQDDRRLWKKRGEGNCGLGWTLVGGPDTVDISMEEGTEKSREGGGAEAAMQVGDKSSVRKRFESEDCRL